MGIEIAGVEDVIFNFRIFNFQFIDKKIWVDSFMNSSYFSRVDSKTVN